MPSPRSNGIQYHPLGALQSCAALEHPGCHSKNVPHGGLCLDSRDSVCQPGSAVSMGVGVCVILLVLAPPLQPQRIQVPCPAPGSLGTGSPREQSRRCRAAHTHHACPAPWAGSVLLTHILTPPSLALPVSPPHAALAVSTLKLSVVPDGGSNAPTSPRWG